MRTQRSDRRGLQRTQQHHGGQEVGICFKLVFSPFTTKEINTVIVLEKEVQAE